MSAARPAKDSLYNLMSGCSLVSYLALKHTRLQPGSWLGESEFWDSAVQLVVKGRLIDHSEFKSIS
jgi:hypothetical protein